ncbi:MAG: hypothetical protein LBF08_06265 [Dysgonamonadaceae bacterium]|jgi:hypothetical protein|nr:hypothetical protein [Dysgonamonadaceae bacterium]
MDDRQDYNRRISSQRMKVEHIIGIVTDEKDMEILNIKSFFGKFIYIGYLCGGK